MSLEKKYDELNGEIDGLFPLKNDVQKDDNDFNKNGKDKGTEIPNPSKFKEVPCGPPGGYVISPEND